VVYVSDALGMLLEILEGCRDVGEVNGFHGGEIDDFHGGEVNGFHGGEIDTRTGFQKTTQFDLCVFDA
jgi:hypothetical protein